jgi:hypothetical protein
MADNSLNQVVLAALQKASGPNSQGAIPDLLPVSADQFSSAVTEASRQINVLTSANQTLIATLLANTQAVIQNSSQTSGKSAASTIGSVASTVLGSGLGLIPLVSSLVNLFGGGKSAPPPLLQYVAPPALQLDLANTPGISSGLGSFSPITYGQNGLPHVAAQDQTQSSAAPQISIQVNALDSQSFMDHSYEIAQAVRSAMLNMHSLNDVVSDL